MCKQIIAPVWVWKDNPAMAPANRKSLLKCTMPGGRGYCLPGTIIAELCRCGGKEEEAVSKAAYLMEKGRFYGMGYLPGDAAGKRYRVAEKIISPAIPKTIIYGDWCISTLTGTRNIKWFSPDKLDFAF